MKLSSKGIGWLIAGVVICASAFPGAGIGDVTSTILIGFTFVAVYVMKQRFRPEGLGWFIAGGIFLAFTVDLFIELIGAFFSRGSDDSGVLSSVVMGAALTCFFMFMFYRRNKDVLEDVVNGADFSDDDDDGFEFPYQEQVFKETVEVVKETAETAKEADADTGSAEETQDSSIIEIEVTDSDNK